MAKYLVSEGNKEMEVYSDSDENAKGHFLKVVEGAVLAAIKIIKVLKEK